PIMVLLDEGEEYDETSPIAQPAVTEKEEAAVTKVVIAKPQTPAPIKSTVGERIKISPLARKTAKDEGIDILSLSPIKPGKRITKSDVLRLRESALSTRVQRGAVTASSTALDTLTITVNADMLVSLCQKLNDSGVAAGNVDIITKAAAVAIREHGAVNGFAEQINIAVEAETTEGLSNPVVIGADKKTVAQIKADVDASVSVASGANFAVTNLGALGVESHVPAKSILNCATLAIGCVTKGFAADEFDNPVVRKQLKMTLAFDADVIDRAVAAMFIMQVQKLVENPMLMLAL
ncbi:MAG: hypothetical protein HN948_04010, partial [Clostridia bacterium]|nr:hypothetical protein [Clostridia bacterium]